MQRFSIRCFILLGISVIFAAILISIQKKDFTNRNASDISILPLVIGEWKGEETPVEKKTKDILETSSVLVRKYTNSERVVWLSIVYYRDSRVALHLPESCSIGQGSFIVKKEGERIDVAGTSGFYANKLILKGDKGNQVILYYFETEELRTGSYMGMRWQTILNKVKHKGSNAALIRVSAVMKESPEKTLELLRQFLNETTPLITQYLFK